MYPRLVATLMNQLRVLFMSHDDARRQATVFALLQAGIASRGCSTPLEMSGLLGEYGCDAIVLDILGREEDYALIARLRAQSGLGIVVIGAPDVDARLRCLQSGADSCLPYPGYEIRELVGVLFALVRRLSMQKAPAINAIEPKVEAAKPEGKWELRDGNWTLVSPKGGVLSLSGNERLILPILLKSAGSTVGRDELARALRDVGGAGDLRGEHQMRSIGVVISRLRRKAELAGISLPIRTVYGSGYLFADDQPG